MTSANEAIVAEIDVVLASRDTANSHAMGVASMRMLAAIERLAPDTSYVAAAQRVATMIAPEASYELNRILTALRDDFADGFALRTLQQRVHASVFEDFLGMAEELLPDGYHVAAAVLAGSVLEEHLHKLAHANDIELLRANGKAKSVEELGVELVKQEAISEPERKIAQGWYGQRTAAAHGHPVVVLAEEVGRMVPGIRDFIARHPA